MLRALTATRQALLDTRQAPLDSRQALADPRQARPGAEQILLDLIGIQVGLLRIRPGLSWIELGPGARTWASRHFYQSLSCFEAAPRSFELGRSSSRQGFE